MNWQVFTLLCVLTAFNIVPAIFHGGEKLCTHRTSSLHELAYNVELESEHVIRKRSIDSPLRIHLHFDQSISKLSSSQQKIVKMTVKEAAEFWESTLRVRPTNHPIRLRKACDKSVVRHKPANSLSFVSYCVGSCRSETICGDITIPMEHLDRCRYYDPISGRYLLKPETSPGVENSDFILYIAAINSEKCHESQTVAYAAHCQQEQGLDRPVAGYFSICPDSISLTKQNRRQLLSTIKHEILHALGFTSSLFAFYRDDDGKPLTPRDPITGRPKHLYKGIYQWSDKVVVRRRNGEWKLKFGNYSRTFSFMVTPRVRAEVRKHFNCPTLEGAELENQGIDGTVLNHWEKRVFENEAMTGTYTQNSVVSRITLAMMEDTGWYKADYSKAGDYQWGKDLGCEFVNTSCYQWIQTRKLRGESIHPFCDQVKRGELWTTCAHNRRSVALCNLVEYQKPLDLLYQYFHSLAGVEESDVGRFAGSVALADYCPYLQEFSWTDEYDVKVRGSACYDKENNPAPENNYFGESYSPNSLCFRHASKWYLHGCDIIKSPHHAGSGCYRYWCKKGLGLVIEVHETSYRCYREGEVIEVSFISGNLHHKGSIVCPSCFHICQKDGITCPREQEPPKRNVTYVVRDALCIATNIRTHVVIQIFICLLSFIS